MGRQYLEEVADGPCIGSALAARWRRSGLLLQLVFQICGVKEQAEESRPALPVRLASTGDDRCCQSQPSLIR